MKQPKEAAKTEIPDLPLQDTPPGVQDDEELRDILREKYPGITDEEISIGTNGLL